MKELGRREEPPPSSIINHRSVGWFFNERRLQWRGQGPEGAKHLSGGLLVYWLLFTRYKVFILHPEHLDQPLAADAELGEVLALATAVEVAQCFWSSIGVEELIGTIRSRAVSNTVLRSN